MKFLTTFKSTLVAIQFIVVLSATAQENLPVIHSNTNPIHIRDGLHFKKDYWWLMPEKKPDYYYVEIPRKEHHVTFITDIDSIRVEMTYGRSYDFIIVWNGKDSCYTRVLSAYKEILRYENDIKRSTDTIPFTIGDNSKIYLQGSINNSNLLNFQFDLGCGGAVIKKEAVDKVNMRFEGTAQLSNSDGINTVRSSSANHLEIAGLKWDSITFLEADNMTKREDAIIGNLFFRDKVVEINYDNNVMIIHDTLPPVNGYSRHELILDGVVPFIQGSFTIGSKKRTGWFMFDTGAYTSHIKTDEISAANKFFDELLKLLSIDNRETHLRIGLRGYEFNENNYTVHPAPTNDQDLGILGNDLLKRFNVILDNQNGFIYLKKNTLIDKPFANPEYYVIRIVLITTVLVIVLFVVRKNRRLKAKYKV